MGPYEKVKSTDFKHTVSAFLQIIYLRAFWATFPSSQPLTHSPFCKIIKSLKQTNTLKSSKTSRRFFRRAPLWRKSEQTVGRKLQCTRQQQLQLQVQQQHQHHHQHQPLDVGQQQKNRWKRKAGRKETHVCCFMQTMTKGKGTAVVENWREDENNDRRFVQ